MKIGIVLSGGGSKGAYEIGVWKALRKLHIKYDLVTGTSVGALNAALMVQNKYFKAVKFWKTLEFSDVIDEEITSNNKKEIYKTYLKGILKGGITVKNLENTVDEAINVNKIYRSKINIGIITFNIKTLKPLILIKKGIPKNKFKDYLIASASCFPAFTKKEIDNESYIDGGIYDNLPINLAIKMGATDIIAVDLEEIGIKQKVKDNSIPIKYIKPRNDIGSFLIFDKDMSKRAIRLGYNDTLKEYKKLVGNKYTFKNLEKNYNKYYGLLKEEIENKFREIGTYKKLLNKKTSYDEFNNIIENLGYLFNIDDSYIYKINKFNKMITAKLNYTEELNIIKSLKENKKIFFNKEVVKYIYNNLDNEKINKYSSLLQKEYLCALYLKVIMENN